MIAEAIEFVDTNVLVYAYDVSAGEKHTRAAALLESLWDTRRGVVSTQVLQEFYVNVTRKLARPLDPANARRVLTYYSRWPMHIVTPSTIISAASLANHEMLSFWDALIVTAARLAGATYLLTEDMQAGRVLDGVRIENPFL